MHDTITTQLEELSRLRHKPPAEVIAEAVKIGLSKLYRDFVLEQYFKKQISRQKATAAIGLDAVKLAEEQRKIIQEDIRWGLRHE